MNNLEYNPNIISKTTFNVPVLFGDIQYSKRKLFSYSIYENEVIREIRFLSRKVLRYEYDKQRFLSKIKIYDENNGIETFEFEFVERSGNHIEFRDWTPGNGNGNHGTLTSIDNGQQYELKFHRVDSYLGYNIKANFKADKMGLFTEEQYFQREKYENSHVLKCVYQNEYALKNSEIDTLAREILTSGWPNDNDKILKICK